ncbi:NUDIX hydrolase [Streptomyces violaceusniger]|uniref:NUDIX hydrolase n=1 Tax=Streptomyces violaceusniger TaxID=68280 RepID=UPI003693657E
MASEETDDRPNVAAAVVVHEGRVLLIRRRVSEGSLRWQFPAGVVEPGEAATEAAVREALEESGLTVAAAQHLGERVHPATGCTISYTACYVLAGEAHAASPREVAEVAWVARRELAEYVPDGVHGPVHAYLNKVLSQI